MKYTLMVAYRPEQENGKARKVVYTQRDISPLQLVEEISSRVRINETNNVVLSWTITAQDEDN